MPRGSRKGREERSPYEQVRKPVPPPGQVEEDRRREIHETQVEDDVEEALVEDGSEAPVMFEDRRDAGRQLGERLRELGYWEALVLGIPRGGVIVAAEVARVLSGELDVIVTAKVRAPHQPELGLGAVGPGGLVVLDEDLLGKVGVPTGYLEDEIEERKEEVERRMQEYRGERGPLAATGREAVIVDDGIATGGTAVAAARALKAMEPSRLTLAVPVAPPQAISRLEKEVDRLVALATPEPFLAVGRFYRRFDQMTDREVSRALSGSPEDA